MKFLLLLRFVAGGPKASVRTFQVMTNEADLDSGERPSRRPRHRRRCLALATSVVILAGGVTSCGSSSSTTSKGTTTTSTTSAAPAKEVNPAGDIPDNQAFVAYAPPGQGYSVKVPEGWARTRTGSASIFTDKLNSIRMERVPTAKAPSPSSVTSVEVQRLAQVSKHFTAGPVSTVRRSAGSAVLVRYQADGQADAVTGKVRRLAVERYEFWRNGHSVVLTLSGAKGADNVDPWKIVTNSFGWKP